MLCGNTYMYASVHRISSLRVTHIPERTVAWNPGDVSGTTVPVRQHNFHPTAYHHFQLTFQMLRHQK
jgi:hypothetical protein